MARIDAIGEVSKLVLRLSSNAVVRSARKAWPRYVRATPARSVVYFVVQEQLNASLGGVDAGKLANSQI